jgi:hypothetical protein
MRDRECLAKQEIFEHKKDKIQLNLKISAMEGLLNEGKTQQDKLVVELRASQTEAA